ncbi:MAG: hypothetical protein KC656_21080, partial [Myxococcales bacterium]|nr:hypothetical protein [Myxococcales bacterium]
MKPHLLLPGLALACKGSPTPVQVPLDTERIELTCTETRARVWRPDALQAGLVHAYAGLAPIVSEDDGRAWRRGGVLPAAEVAAAIGRVGLALEVGEAGQEPYWVATSDLWETLERPSFTASADPWLPEGAYEASLADGTRVAVTDTGRVYAHLDGAWRGAPDAYALGAGLFGARLAASDGDRELVVQGSGPGQTLAGTEDRAATWDVPVVHPGEVITDLAMNADGLVVAGWDYGEGEIDSGISVSPDFARTWTHLPLHLQRVSLGPGPQEIWATAVVGVDATGEILELRHTTDAGATWTRVELWAGEALVDPVYDATGLLGTRRVFLDGAGARVLPLATHAGPGVPQESWRCVEGGPGGFVRQEVSRDDSPGTVTLWDRNPEALSDSLGAVVPGLEPGEGVWPTWTFAGTTALGPIRAMDHDADLTGLVALAQYDGDVFDGFSTLLEVDLDGSIVGSRPWDTYGEDDGGGLDAVPLAGAHMRVDPVTGVARVITDVGIVRITDSLQAQIPELP